MKWEIYLSGTIYDFKKNFPWKILELSVNTETYQDFISKKGLIMFFEPPYSVVIIDDDPEILSVMTLVLNSKYPDMLQINPYTKFSTGFDFITNNRSNIVFLDLNLLDADGITGLEKIKELHKKFEWNNLKGKGVPTWWIWFSPKNNFFWWFLIIFWPNSIKNQFFSFFCDRFV